MARPAWLDAYNAYRKCKGDYNDTHIRNVGKTTPQQIKTFAGMLKRTIEIALGAVGAVLGAAMANIGAGTRSATAAAVGSAVYDKSASSLVNILEKNTTVSKGVESAMNGLKEEFKSGFVTRAQEKAQKVRTR